MLSYVKTILVAEFDAALCMLNDCIQKCPPAHWDGKVAKYPFWMVVYHTLCFVDCYLAPSNDEFEFRPEYHPAGRAELEEEYPSRRFEQHEMAAYLAICRKRMLETLSADTRESLEAPCGFSHLPMSRGELRIYNIRHVMHHTGQLSAYLRKVGVDTRWIKTGWK